MKAKDRIMVDSKDNIRNGLHGILIKVNKGSGSARVLFYGGYKEWFDIAELKLVESNRDDETGVIIICIDNDINRLEGILTATNGKVYRYVFEEECINSK